MTRTKHTTWRILLKEGIYIYIERERERERERINGDGNSFPPFVDILLYITKYLKIAKEVIIEVYIYLEESPFLTSITDLSQCLGPLLPIELREVNHWDRHWKEKIEEQQRYRREYVVVYLVSLINLLGGKKGGSFRLFI
jgi:hypothetical protein